MNGKTGRWTDEDGRHGEAAKGEAAEREAARGAHPPERKDGEAKCKADALARARSKVSQMEAALAVEKRKLAELEREGSSLWDVSNPPLLLRCHASTPEPAYAGVFDYAGFGYGTVYLPDGQRIWCDGSEARRLCAEHDLECICFDRRRAYRGVYLGD